jgi:hypothetical protein
MEVYEGEPVPDGEYKLVQLSNGKCGRVEKDPDEAYNAMPVEMSDDKFKALREYVSGNWKDGFMASVRNHRIVHVY